MLYDPVLELDIPDILGVDIAGYELIFTLELFIDYLNRVGKHKIAIHAGEVGTPEQIWFAVDILKTNHSWSWNCSIL